MFLQDMNVTNPIDMVQETIGGIYQGCNTKIEVDYSLMRVSVSLQYGRSNISDWSMITHSQNLQGFVIVLR